MEATFYFLFLAEIFSFVFQAIWFPESSLLCCEHIDAAGDVPGAGDHTVGELDIPHTSGLS